MSIGFKIKKLREDKKLSQPHLAEILGVSQGDLSKIENDQTKKIDFLLMDKVCKEFDVDFRYFTESSQISTNTVENNDGSVVGFNHGTINLCPEYVLKYVQDVFNENINLKKENNNLRQNK
jgi:transcriptional regulator with XRE-family HTH domain